MQLDIESMRTYLAVLDWGSMTRAASQLDLTQSAVSWKIKRLEQRVGRPLLIRDGHELRPSQAGRILLDEARAIVEAHDRVAHRLESPEFTGRVRVGSNEEVGASRMAGILGRFNQLFNRFFQRLDFRGHFRGHFRVRSKRLGFHIGQVSHVVKFH